MIFDQAQLKFLITGKITTARLPIRTRRDVTGIMPCPVKAGRSYPLRIRVPATEDEPSTVKTTSQHLRVLDVQKDLESGTWMVVFEHGKLSAPRFLSASAPAATDDDKTMDPSRRVELEQRDDARGYTSTTAHAITDAGECVDDLALERYAVENDQDRVRRIVDYEKQRRGMALEDRLAAVREAAKANGIDIRRQEASIAQRITAMERLVQRRNAA